MKNLKLIGLLAVVSLVVTGCSLDSMPDLTTEESAIISEYAAGLLLKYSPNYDYKVVDNIEILTPTEDEEEGTEVIETEETETSTEVETLDIAQTSGDNESELAQDTAIEVAADENIASILGVDAVSIKYESYELSDSYPKDKNGYTVSASQGNTLLVVHFSIENKSDEDYTLNLIEDNMSAKFTVNDSLSGNGLSTMLPDDLLTYYDTISAGDTVDAVILAQLYESTAQELNAISVKISSSNGSVDLKIE